MTSWHFFLKLGSYQKANYNTVMQKANKHALKKHQQFQVSQQLTSEIYRLKKLK